MNNEEFKFLGNTIENISIKYGVFLVIWACIISWLGASQSITSWIPALLGLPIFIFGWLSRVTPNKKKIFMHISVIFGLIAFLGGMDFFRGFKTDLGPFSNPLAGASKLMLLLSGAAFCYFCVKSFIIARKSRQELSISNEN